MLLLLIAGVCFGELMHFFFLITNAIILKKH